MTSPIMADIQSLERQVRDILATETDAIRLSDALFRPGGLFAPMASTKEERRTLAASPLFKEAQRRLAGLRRAEGEEFSLAVESSQHAATGASPWLHRVERV
jgi:hypothetical protein